jgi:hypothetical protein
LRIERQMRGAALLVLQQIHRHLFMGNALQVQRESYPPRCRRARTS